jgi:hypothetical protein
VFETRVQKRIFELKRGKVVGGWRRLNEELYNLYTSPNVVRVVKSMKIRGMGHEKWIQYLGCKT